MAIRNIDERIPRAFGSPPFQAVLGLFLILLSVGCQTAGIDSDGAGAELQRLYDAKEFFLFRDRLSAVEKTLASEDAAYFRALALGLENRVGESSEIIRMLHTENPGGIAPERIITLGFLEIDNRMKSGEYGNAVSAIDFLLSENSDCLGDEALADLRNSRILFDFLSDVPPPRTVVNRDAVFPLERDALGLLSIRGRTASGSVDFDLDTGADFSVVRESVAEQLGLEIESCEFDVTAGATGTKIPSRIAVAEFLEVGSLTLLNTVFLVFDDDALTFPDIGETIDAILGYPVLQAMGELRFDFKGSELTVPAEARDYRERNLLFDGFSPLVSVEHEEGPMAFLVDSGADRTILYEPFLRRHPEAVETDRPRDALRLGGAGGVVEVEGYEGIDIAVTVGSQTGFLRDLRIILDSEGVHDRYSGILGQDFLFRFDEMIFSFASSSLVFR